MELFDSVEERLLVIPKTGISFELRVRLYDRENDESAFVEYTTRKNEHKLILNSSDYLYITYRDQKEEQYKSIWISYLNIGTLQRGFAEARKFIDNCFIEDDNGRTVVDPQYSNGISITDLGGGDYIRFIPMTLENDGTMENSIIMEVGSKEYSGSMSYSTFVQITEFIRRFDLYSSSKMLLNTMINYCNYGTPYNKPVKKHDPPPMHFIKRRNEQHTEKGENNA